MKLYFTYHTNKFGTFARKLRYVKYFRLCFAIMYFDVEELFIDF